MKENFTTAKKVLRTGNAKINVVAVNGCCYGSDKRPDKGEYFKYCGQQFWDFISDDPELFVKIIEPLGHKAEERNEDFMTSYGRVINKFTREFANEFCKMDGEIDWDKLVIFNSGKET